jgi:hypothetical protein
MSPSAALCPNCGAALRFTWSGSVQTVCSHCRSIVVRHDVDLQRVGEVSDPPPDTSPIQLGTTGRFDGRAFEVIGRLAYQYDGGAWSEWHLLFGDGETGWLSDAQLRYAVYERVTESVTLPSPGEVVIGSTVSWRQRRFDVVAITDARYRGTEGELPFESWDRDVERFVDLRGEGPAVGTIDYSDDVTALYVGRAASFEDLGLRNLRDVDRTNAVPVGALKCGQCAAPLVIKAPGQSQSVVCGHCGSIADATDPNVAVLQTVDKRVRITPRIPLGSSGDWHGARYEVIGFQRRTITVEGTDYSWHEYVLFNPLHGFRYLSEYGGHWNDIAVLDETPSGSNLDAHASRELRGRTYRHFQSALARTTFVLGEFPWVVNVGEAVEVHDYVAPPFLLSREGTAKESTWSLGTYTRGEAIWRAFSLEGAPPSASGVFANQPSPVAAYGWPSWGMFAKLAALLVVVAVIRLVTSGSNVFDGRFQFDPSSANPAFVTEPFELTGRAASVEVALDSNLRNNWMVVNLALINDQTGVALDFARELGYYFGVEGGESWHEGSQGGRVVLPTVTPGRYYLRVEPEGNPSDRSLVDYGIHVRRDRPAWGFYGIALLLLAAPPLLVTLRHASFEHARWSESDHAGDDDEDEEDDD